MEGVLVPYIFLHDKNLTSYDAVILAYIMGKCDSDFCFHETNDDIARQLNTNPVSLPNVISKLYKLGYIDITHDSKKRIIIYTYDAPHRGADSGYIYIMRDTSHSYLKIGFSKDPKYRESTLQGEKPTIELIGKYKGTMSQEQTCHRILAKHRVRGEWFNITVDQAEATIKKVIGVA